MAVETSILINNGKIVWYKDHQDDRPGGAKRIFDNGKRYRHRGWEIKLLDSKRNHPGKIVCRMEYEHRGALLNYCKEYALSDGMLELDAKCGNASYVEDEFYGYSVEYEMFYSANFKKKHKIEQDEHNAAEQGNALQGNVGQSRAYQSEIEHFQDYLNRIFGQQDDFD